MSNEIDLSWFDLSKYDSVREFTIFDWYIQLASRLCFKKPNNFVAMGMVDDCIWLENTNDPSDREHQKFDIGLKKNNKYYFEKIKKEPIIRTNLTVGSLPLFSDGIQYPVPVVRGAKIGDVYHMDDIRKQLNETIEECFERPLLHDDESINMGLISINFNAPESLIIEQLKKIVKNKKSGHKLFSDSDMRGWEDLCILPCIDLLIYVEMNDVSIEHNIIGQLLFPDTYNIALPDRVRRSVLPKAKKLLTVKTVLSMEQQLLA